MTSCKDDDFPFFCHFFEEGEGVGPNGEVDFHCCLLYKNVEVEVGLALGVFIAMNEGFI